MILADLEPILFPYPFCSKVKMKSRILPRKRFAALAAALLLGLGSMAVQGATVFYIGIDNDRNSDFEQEGNPRNDNKYYWENGDYTAVTGIAGSAGVNWTKGQEIWQDGAADTTWANSLDGFARAITNSWTTHHIYFQLDPDEVGSGKTLTFTIDFLTPSQSEGNPPSSHNVNFYLDNVLFHTESDINAARLVTVTGIDASMLAAGSHVLSWQRTGGVNGWVSIDYLSLESVPEPSRATLLMLATGGVLWRRRR
jgi:hypothetical protein